jgi:hypothetical protein
MNRKADAARDDDRSVFKIKSRADLKSAYDIHWYQVIAIRPDKIVAIEAVCQGIDIHHSQTSPLGSE